MKKLLAIATGAGLALMSLPAQALLIDHGITYDLPAAAPVGGRCCYFTEARALQIPVHRGQLFRRIGQIVPFAFGGPRVKGNAL